MSSRGPSGSGVLRVFAVHLKNPAAGVVDSVVEKFPASYRLSDSTVLIRTPLLASQIAGKIGFGAEGQVAGAVFKLNDAFAGYYDTDLWDWLDNG